MGRRCCRRQHAAGPDARHSGAALDNIQPASVPNGALVDQILTTVAITLAVLWPLFKPWPRRILDTISLTHKRVFITAAALATIRYFDWSTRLPRTTLIGAVIFLSVVLPVWFVVIRWRPAASTRALIVGDDGEIILSCQSLAV